MSQDQFVFGPFWTGQVEAYADPMRVDRELRAGSAGQLMAWLRDIEATGPADAEGDSAETLEHKAVDRWRITDKAKKSAEAIIVLVRDVFKMTPFDEATGKGGTENDCYRVLFAWLAFKADQKKSGPPSPG